MSDGPDITTAQTENTVQESLVTAAPKTSDAPEHGASENSTPAEPDAAAVEAGKDDASSESYADFVLPEGMELDGTLLEEATPMFKELGLTQEQAQKLVDFQAKQVQAREQAQGDAFNQLMDDWKKQSLGDKEFGGDKFEQSIGVARSALDKFGTPELKTLLEEHGVGNHPEVIRFMVKVGQLTREDNPGAGAQAPSEKRDRASILYGNN